MKPPQSHVFAIDSRRYLASQFVLHVMYQFLPAALDCDVPTPAYMWELTSVERRLHREAMGGFTLMVVSDESSGTIPLSKRRLLLF